MQRTEFYIITNSAATTLHIGTKWYI